MFPSYAMMENRASFLALPNETRSVGLKPRTVLALEPEHSRCYLWFLLKMQFFYDIPDLGRNENGITKERKKETMEWGMGKESIAWRA